MRTKFVLGPVMPERDENWGTGHGLYWTRPSMQRTRSERVPRSAASGVRCHCHKLVMMPYLSAKALTFLAAR